MSEKEYTTRDRKAENGITINNVLLSIVILGGGIFGTVFTGYLSHLTTSVSGVETAISSLRSVGNVTANELNHINSKIANCKEFHLSIANRVRDLEYRKYESTKEQ